MTALRGWCSLAWDTVVEFDSVVVCAAVGSVFCYFCSLIVEEGGFFVHSGGSQVVVKSV